MKIPIPYQWSYERNPWDSVEGADTFSVGVFQFLPKASGRGLKRSKTIRIKGYVSNPDDVYKLADEICAKLNKGKVRFENPPSWLQKQYSAPKPEGRVEPKSDKLTSAQVRRHRIQLANALLIPKGFVSCPDSTYARRVGRQFQIMNFQGNKYGGSYTINLGFGYDFLPPKFHRRICNLSELHLLDCLDFVRVGDFLPGRDAWFEYGTDVEMLREHMRRNIAACLDGLDLLEPAQDPRAWSAGKMKHTVWNSFQSTQVMNALLAIHLNDSAMYERHAKSLLKGDYAKSFNKLCALARQKKIWIVG